ncbi:MAG: glycoside hydrolase family 16 protein [Muribaculaceae bacterium]|nr:glycoside hydrolase family 16 protein [Muribaculaceae bacterium]
MWSDDFNGSTLDSTVWSRTERGTPDWANTQSKDERCLEMRDGLLVLKGIVNDNLETDSAPYLTGGIYTKGKKSFDPGRFEIKARLHGAKGAWPAIWLLPYETEKYHWPLGGEIDIMERLNNDSVAYQTVHSHYTYDLGRDKDPISSLTSPINRDDFNVYGVDMYPDSIVFHINGERTHAYPRIAEYADSLGQFPFNIPQYLLIDMQLGGQWVGEVDPADLPVEMEIDWVKYYQLK